uniref:BTB domain-containing protein n=1 Tax=Araucaria cunninghamii TaxID=56994 RepID=A0A0D6QYQ3_ARACU
MERGDPRIVVGSERKGHKRKLAETSLAALANENDNTSILPQDVKIQVNKLNSTFSWREADRFAARRAAHAIAEFAKHEDHVDVIVGEGAIPALVQHLQAPIVGEDEGPIAYEHEVEKEAAFALGLLAVKPEHQRLIADAGALTGLVSLLKRHGNSSNARIVNGVLRRAADAITNLAHENGTIKTYVRTEGGIPPLVDLLESNDTKVQRAAAGALRTLAFKNEPNKNQIVECNALPTLILMLRSEDVGIHYEAVGVIGNLVHSSTNIKKEVLLAGALQPVIGLLSSRCHESQREAALLLGQFATTDPECKVHIVQRGAVRPLTNMLQMPDPQLKEMAAFALGRLAQNSHNQAGIVHDGGLIPLLDLLDSKNGSLQHNAAFALYGLADNEDNVSDIVKEGGVQKLQDVELIVQASKDCVAKTLKRLEEKINGRVLKHLLYLMRVSERTFQRRVALALAHLCSPDDQRMIFINNSGLEVLLGLLGPTANSKQQHDGAVALHTLAKRAAAQSPIDAALPPPTPQVYLGEKYVNSNTLSDVTFLVEGRRFYAHRIALLASSDAFRAMFDGGYREKEAKDIEIPNISWGVFELMMRFIYTGTVEVTSDIAQDLLRAADQYLLEGLKRLCEYAIAQDLTVENFANVYDLAEAYHATSLRHTCVLYFLEQHEQMSTMPCYSSLVERLVPEIRDYLFRILRPQPHVPAQ